MTPAQRLRATYEFKPVDHLVRREFFFWGETTQRWKAEGMAVESPWDAPECNFDGKSESSTWLLGWTTPAFVPAIKETVLEDCGEYQIVRDVAGRTIRQFSSKNGVRKDFMPMFLKHAVVTDRDWEEDVAPLLSPTTPERLAEIDRQIPALVEATAQGLFISHRAIAGYMYLRSLVGPEEICYLLLDNPSLVHKMMRGWLALADAVTARIQRHVELDEIFLAEDICYNHGLLISPDMVREFLLPYYQQLLASTHQRQKAKRIYFQVDTDGHVADAIGLYRSIGLDVMSPFEVAAGNDVVAIAQKYPNLVMTGGIDKRILASGPAAVDEYLGRIMPFMVKRGGFIPTCDHGVPHDVPWQNYLYYRRRICELDHI